MALRFSSCFLSAALVFCGSIGAFAQGGGKPSDPGKPGDPGKPVDTSGQTKVHAKITWLTDKAGLEAVLLDPENTTMEVDVQFQSSGDIENLDVWLTPSLQGVTADPESFDEIKKDVIYTITLKLDERPTHTMGGTLHLRDASASNRSYAAPLPINVKFKGTNTGTQETEQKPATVHGVVSSTDYRTGAVTPGQTMSLFGDGIGPDQPHGAKLDDRGRVSKYLGDVQVLFNGIPAPILAASRNQVNVVVPQGVTPDGTVEIVVTYKGKVSQTVTLPVEPTAPALFTIGGSGFGQSAALNQDGSVNSPSSRARRGGVLTLFGSGFGDWNESIADGTIIGSELPTPKAPVSVTIGGAAAKVLYAGGAPGLVSGVVQLNVEVPLGILSGDRVTVVVNAGGKTSPGSVTVAIQ